MNNYFREVTRGNPCSRCGRSNHCSRSIDQHFEICRKINDGSGTAKLDKNGDEYYIYYCGPKSTGRTYHRSYRKTPDFDQSVPERASSQELHQVYSELLNGLSLSNSHDENLKKRGFSDDEIRKREFKSLPLKGRFSIVQRMCEKFGKTLLLKVPGFYSNNKSRISLAGPPGILIPVRNVQEEIIALKIRRDDEVANGQN